MTDETNFTASGICINMESIEVVSSVRRAPPEKPSQAIPKATTESPLGLSFPVVRHTTNLFLMLNIYLVIRFMENKTI